MKKIEAIQKEFGTQIARAALDMQAIKLDPVNPFRWASGYRMPMYNDNRRLLANSTTRKQIADGFRALTEALNLSVEVVAGTATAGIPHATTLADSMGLPLVYVRSSGKDHGLGQQIEGPGPSLSLEGKEVLLIEDLISTGGSSIKAIKALQETGAKVSYCLSIFTYGFDAAREAFSSLAEKVGHVSLLDYDTMLQVAEESGYLDTDGVELLSAWREDPFTWGRDHGFE